MPEPTEPVSAQPSPDSIPAPVLELLAAVRDALDCTGLDDVGRIRRMAHVRVCLGSVLSGAEVDAKFPDLPGRTAERMTEAADLLRGL